MIYFERILTLIVGFLTAIWNGLINCGTNGKIFGEREINKLQTEMGKHKDRGSGAARKRYNAKNPRGKKKGGKRTKVKRNVKRYSTKKK